MDKEHKFPKIKVSKSTKTPRFNTHKDICAAWPELSLFLKNAMKIRQPVILRQKPIELEHIIVNLLGNPRYMYRGMPEHGMNRGIDPGKF
jgi:hypothetical protein